MEYPDALSFLFGLQRFGLRPGLEATRRLAAAVGNPHHALRFIHVAGTNGKGSTCAFLESACRLAGLRAGLYTSPHLVSFRERIQVNREWIPEADVARLVAITRQALDGIPDDGHPTFFELVTVVALQWFREQRCDVVIWETGMGGRWDATNIVTPLASIITNIGWDHMQWLGNTLAAIASEKAGILKPGIPAFTATAEPEALEVIRAAARELPSPLREVTPADPEIKWIRTIGPGLPGRHQWLNAALAVVALRSLRAVLPIPEAALTRGLQEARWPGRFQILHRPGQCVVLDGAHNEPAFRVLIEALAEAFPVQPFTLILGMLADKDARAAARLLVPGSTRTLIVPLHTKRAGDPTDLAAACAGVPGAGPVTVTAGLDEALTAAASDPLVVVTGSLYLVGEALEALGRAPWAAPSTTSERNLNDWSPRP